MILQNLDAFFADNSLGVCSFVRRCGFVKICHSERSEESHMAESKFDARVGTDILVRPRSFIRLRRVVEVRVSSGHL